jgi:hypothetical protein
MNFVGGLGLEKGSTSRSVTLEPANLPSGPKNGGHPVSACGGGVSRELWGKVLGRIERLAWDTR